MTDFNSSGNSCSVLDGITLYAMGDSYFAGKKIGRENSWVSKMCEKHSMHYVNYGSNGSTMSNFADKNPMVDRFSNMEKGDADIILLEGGRNDLNNCVPMGELESRDVKTFMGAVNFMLDSMINTYPCALIILVTPWHYTKPAPTELTNVDYANALLRIAVHRNDPRVVCLYAADPSFVGVDMDDEAFRAQYCIAPNDPSHLNIEGMELVLPKMEKFIEQTFETFKRLA